MANRKVAGRLAAGVAGLVIALGWSADAAAQSAAAQDQAANPSSTPADLAPPAAQSPAQATTGNEQPAGGLEDIVVTAERRQQSLQQVPISATVLNAADLNRKGVTGIADIQQVAPSVAINTFNRSTFINIRGVGIAQSAPTSNPGVAFYIDGMLIPHEQFIAQNFYDIGSIEVLRGPQGTLTGQNSTGGAIYVRTPEPDSTALSGYIDGSYGNYNIFKLTGAVNVPLGEQFAVRAAATHEHRDSFTTNIGPSGSQPGNLDLYAARINLAGHSANEVLRANLRLNFFDSKSDNNPIKRRGDTVSTDPFVIEEDARSFQNQHGGQLSQETKIAVLPAVDLRTMVSYQSVHTIDQTDGDRSATAPARPPANAVGRVSLVSTDIDTFMGEVNLLSTGKRDFNWVVGGFYLNEKVDTLSQRDNNHTTDFVSSTSTFKTRAFNTTKSGFAQINWTFFGPLELIAGGRYSDDQQVYDRLIPAGAVPVGASLVGVQHSTKVTGKVGLNYHLGGNLLYVTASEGYKAGGVNLTVGTPNFGPEKNRVYEAGFKSQFFDNRIRLNGDVFYSRYRDIQLSSLLGGLPVTQNAAAGKSYGAELELTGQFGPLLFNAGAGYLHARFDGSTCITDTNANGTDPGCPTNLRFVPDGRVLPFSPEMTINAGVQYEVPLNDRGLSLTPRVQWAHLSSQVATPFPSFNTVVPARDVFDARLTMQVSPRYRVEAYVQNFTDRRYIASQIQNSSSADGGIIYGAPRTFGGRLVAKF